MNEELLSSLLFTDHDVENQVRYQYKLGLVMGEGSEVLLGPLGVFTSESAGEIVLYSNPLEAWTGNTVFNYYLPSSSSSVSLNIYDISGKLVKTLVNGAHESGRNSVIWDGSDSDGRSVPSGVFFCQLSSESETKTSKFVMIK